MFNLFERATTMSRIGGGNSFNTLAGTPTEIYREMPWAVSEIAGQNVAINVVDHLAQMLRYHDGPSCLGQVQPLIARAGDMMLRGLLVGSAQYILGPFGPDTDLRRWGTTIASRGGKNTKKRAVVAVARKLAGLLYHLWVSGETYVPRRRLEIPPMPVAA